MRWPWSRRSAASPAPLQTPQLALEPPPALPTRAPKRGVIAASTSPAGEWYSAHPGRGLTADAIRMAYDAAEQGHPFTQCDIFDDVLERDGHLRSLVETRLQAVAGKPWIVQAGGDDDADVKAARELEEALRRIPHLHQTWEHILSAVFYGYSATEIEWDMVNGRVVPVWLANVPHRRIRFDEADEPRLTTKDDWRQGLVLEPGKWIWCSMRGRRAARTGLMRVAVWWSWLKSLSIRDWQIYAARFGIPFVVAKHNPTADIETIKKLTEAVLAFGKQGGACFPDEGEIEVITPTSMGSNGSVHPALAEMANRELSKLISGATLTSGEGTSAGSYALGRVHQDQSFNLVLADAERLATWFECSLGSLFVAFNGLNCRPPRLKSRVVREIDPLARIQIASIYANELGGELDDDQIREENDFKRPKGTALRGTKSAGAGEPPGGGEGPPAVDAA